MSAIGLAFVAVSIASALIQNALRSAAGKETELQAAADPFDISICVDAPGFPAGTAETLHSEVLQAVPAMRKSSGWTRYYPRVDGDVRIDVGCPIPSLQATPAPNTYDLMLTLVPESEQSTDVTREHFTFGMAATSAAVIRASGP